MQILSDYAFELLFGTWYKREKHSYYLPIKFPDTVVLISKPHQCNYNQCTYA